MKGRTCLVTGATSGIGKATALALARLDAEVILVARDAQRGASAAAEIAAASGNDAVSVLLADLTSQDSIRGMVKEFKAKHEYLHVLINNAGVSLSNRSVTPDGIEATLAVNHLAPFLLTNLLLDTMVRSAPARIVNVTSTAFRHGRIDFDDLHAERRYSGMRAYNQSKLANVVFTHELTRRLAGTGVTVNCVHPGVVRSNLGLDSFLHRAIGTVAKPFILSPDQGAATSVYVASAPELEGVTGKFFMKKAEAATPDTSRDESLGRRLWQVSEEMTGLTS